MWLLFLKNYKVVLAVAAMSFAFIAGYSLRGALCDSTLRQIEIDTANAALAESQERRERALEYEKEVARLRKSLASLEVENETRKPEYSCIVPAGGVQLINKAIAIGATGKLGNAL